MSDEKGDKKDVKVQDLAPKKDAKGGGARNLEGGGINQSGGGINQSGGGFNQSGGGANQSGGGANQSGTTNLD